MLRSTLFFSLFCLSLANLAVQGQKPALPEDGQMRMMGDNPYHSMALTYRSGAMAFAKVLAEMAKGGEIKDLALARTALSEIKQNLEGAEQIHERHLKSMSPTEAAKMQPMTEKMEARKDEISATLRKLGSELESSTPNALTVETLSRELTAQLKPMSNGHQMPNSRMKPHDGKPER